MKCALMRCGNNSEEQPVSEVGTKMKRGSFTIEMIPVIHLARKRYTNLRLWNSWSEFLDWVKYMGGKRLTHHKLDVSFTKVSESPSAA